jgi:sulfite exporter TauE/SafE/copper chaperone CopZ/plastocyanin domain-containing protein
MEDLKTEVIRIRGMTCGSCAERIARKLKNIPGVENVKVNYLTGRADVTWNDQTVTLNELKAAIESLGYQVLGRNDAPPVREIIGIAVILFGLYALIQRIGAAADFPLAETGMSYGMLFVIGLITSLHCVAMCGGINLSQCIPSAEANRRKVMRSAVLYNAGRVISYTAIGGIAGVLGSVVSLSGRFQGIVQVIAGICMILMGVNMLGIFPCLRRFTILLPKIFTKKITEKIDGAEKIDGTEKIDGKKSNPKNPLIIGLLNGLMPCGPLQAMQVYALSTGSPISGGLSMFIFSMGTVPLMFGLGALSAILSGKFFRAVMRIGAILVTVMGMTMFTYGWGLSGFNVNFPEKFTPVKASAGGAAPFAPVIEKGVQVVHSTLNSGRYPAITVQQGIPVKWTITAPPGSVNGCNNRMIIREYNIQHRFTVGENTIEFMPEKTGKFSYSCWMGMIRSSITVLAEGQSSADTGEPDLAPVPAGVSIPIDSIAFAEMQTEGYQTITTNLRDDGIDPALIIVRRGVPALWTITNDSLDPGNSRLIFPAYYVSIDMEQGSNTIQVMPAADFDFSTADNVFYGYVKVVDDLNAVDIESVKAEVKNFETLIYPPAYFETPPQGGCCGNPGA